MMNQELVTFASERIGDLDRMIRELRSLRADIVDLDEDSMSGDRIDEDDLCSQLLERFRFERDKAQEFYDQVTGEI